MHAQTCGIVAATVATQQNQIVDGQQQSIYPQLNDYSLFFNQQSNRVNQQQKFLQQQNSITTSQQQQNSTITLQQQQKYRYPSGTVAKKTLI